ncbi:hypothetical protein HBA54_24555 [Pelagibius litoralis]|uniref:Uncharacterized protein n=1 Tax=Pelagibius litoralis TaxID=374515 RepID=A0A967F244_9PROT|nr:hypothetical protein [Pelagibius litoralis]NIA71771.1 hypothetical protein [Pelagibius litoralis]
MNKTALAIRHVAFEDLGSFQPVLQAQGYETGYREAGLDDLSDPAFQAVDLLLVLATQFHIEATAQGLERWFIGHTLEIATTLKAWLDASETGMTAG